MPGTYDKHCMHAKIITYYYFRITEEETEPQ